MFGEEIKGDFTNQDIIDLSLCMDLELESYTSNLNEEIMLNFKKTNEIYFDKKDKEKGMIDLEKINELENKIRSDI